MYKLELKANERILLITIKGLLTESESIEYIKELKKNTRSIDPVEYCLVANLRELKASPQKLRSFMEEAIAYIAATKFKKRYCIIPESVIACSQLKRIGKRDDKFIFVQSYESILQEIA